MEFLVVLVVTVIMASLFSDKIKNNGKALYLAAGIISIIGIIIDISVAAGFKASGFLLQLENGIDYVNNGMLATALFITVMYIGALNGKSKFVENLLKIRAELSIIACILLAGHIFSFTRILLGDLSSITDLESPGVIIRIITMICAFIAVFICIPLFVTSFKNIRNKMDAKKWKRLQSLAYIFYALIYLHIMTVLFIQSREHNTVPEIVLYSAIFISYSVLRIRKNRLKNETNCSESRNNKKVI